ncbi:MAG: ribosome silencing factor [Gammaproteobacteria bacterium]|nr:ribosome silencing factor [Gammaproteobacteria bacterium]
MRPGHDTSPNSLTDLVLESVEDRKGVDPLALDVTALTDITDTMVIVGGTSNRHVKAIVDNVLEVTKAHGIKVLGVEGRTENHWVLIDLADVVVHVMRAEARAFYDLERLWEQPGALRSTPVATTPGPA